MRLFKKGLAIVALTATAFSSAFANDIRINGFASIAAGTTLHEAQRNGEKAQFIADQPSGAIYTDTFDFRPDSVYGLQITSDLSEGLSVVGQILGTGGEDYDAKMSWGYIKYEATENTTVLAGRQRLPLYFYSDVLDVGYSYHWMRPPTEGALPADTLDGIQVRYETTLGNWDSRLQLFTGTSEANFADVGQGVGFDNIYGVVAFASNDWLQLRASYMTNDFYYNIDIDETLRDLAAQGLIITADAIQTRNNTVGSDYFSASVHATFGDAFVVSEYSRSEFEDPLFGLNLESLSAGFVSAGYQMGDLTPHITYGYRKSENSFIPGFGAGELESDSITIGARYDFHPKAAFKIEYLTRNDDTPEQRYAAYRPLAPTTSMRELDLFTLGVDVIF